jgi:ADP-ribosylglycohydrolase
MTRIAESSSWKSIPISMPVQVSVTVRFSEAQYLRLQRGLLPEQMEDKWFVFFEDDWLYFHRSWTGYGIYKAQIVKEQDGAGYSINEFSVERDEEFYDEKFDDSDRDNLSFLIGKKLLGIDYNEFLKIATPNYDDNNLPGWKDFAKVFYLSPAKYYNKEIKAALFGVAVGDALGVPVEFKSREFLRKNPVTDMVGFGTYNQPEGTFSDDTSLTFCLAEALTEEYYLPAIAKNFIEWRFNNYWTARGEVFDIGISTREAIDRLAKGERPDLAGGFDETSNGNGSLMRILPLVFHLFDKPTPERFDKTKEVSSITHAHMRSVLACFYYLEFARHLLDKKDKFEIYHALQTEIPKFLSYLIINPDEIKLFDRLLKKKIYELPESEISSSGYVLHTLEASIWCLLTTDNFKDAVLKAVNLGEDTDTTAAVTGGLAGLLYGFEAIPQEWVKKLARTEDIEDLAVRLGSSY